MLCSSQNSVWRLSGRIPKPALHMSLGVVAPIQDLAPWQNPSELHPEFRIHKSAGLKAMIWRPGYFQNLSLSKNLAKWTQAQPIDPLRLASVSDLR